MNAPGKTPLEKYYSDDENCIRDISIACEKINSDTTTESEYDAMQKSLAIMLADCSDVIRKVVFNTAKCAAAYRFIHEERWIEEKVKIAMGEKS